MALQETALGHLRILDLTHYIAGPYCTKLFADLGADVIKVERPQDGDGVRTMRPFLDDIPGKERSGLFWYLNTNKRSITLDLKSEKDHQVLRKLASQCDAVVENFSPDVLERLGLGYEELRRDNPALVMTSISNFGQTGPYRDYKATDIVANALTGLMSTSGRYDREPLKHGLHQAAFRAGQYAAGATLAGMFAAQRTGRGQHIEVSLMECLVTGFVLGVEPYTYQGHILGRDPKTGLAAGGHAQPIETSDGYVFYGASQSSGWEDLAIMLEEPALEDPKFSTQDGRIEYAAELDEILQRNFKTRSRYELVQMAQEWRWGFNVTQSITDLLRCAQLEERRYFVEVDHPEARAVKIPGAPYKFSVTPHSIRRRAPTLGEHTSQVLAELPKSPRRLASQASGSANRLPLQGIRVLEPAAAYAAPYAGRMLAWLGAEVIKVESLIRPCNLRQAARGPVPGREPTHPYWNEEGNHNDGNLGKKNITLDFRTDEGRQAFKELVSISDVVLENWTPRVMKGFGLGYDELVKVKPDLVMVSVTGYGHSGPYRDYSSFGRSMEAATGCAWVTGYPGGPPHVCGSFYADDLTAMHALVAMLGALQYRNATGRGQWVDLAMYEAGRFIAEALIDGALNGREAERLGNRDRNCVPQGCYRSLGTDQWVTLSVTDHDEWLALCNLVGRSALATNPNFQTTEQRWERHDEIDRYIQEWTQTRDKFQAMHELQKAGIPSGAVLTNKDILLNRHLWDRDYFVKITHKNPHVGQKTYRGMPFMFNGVRLPNPPPNGDFGEHNRPVLVDLLGKDPELVKEWEKRDIIGTVPMAARTAAPRQIVSSEVMVERGNIQGYDTDYEAIIEQRNLVG